MLENQLSRYGAVTKSLPFRSTGKFYFVVGPNDTIFGDFQKTFPNDKDGQVRVYSTIAAALAVAQANETVYVFPQQMAQTSTDPVSYAETVTITQPGLALIGVPTNRTQGGLPQIKKGSGSTALVTVRAPGVTIANLGFNGGSSTGGGILLDDDGGSTKSAFGTQIINCHFKNCVGSTATDGSTGGAIQWTSSGNAWQVLIKGCRFYKNVADIVLKGTGGSIPQDVVIEDNVFGDADGSATDCNLYLAGGSGMIGLVIRNNTFGTFPALSSGANLMYIKATGCKGVMSNNFFGSTGKTFGAAANVVIPTTLLMAGNYQEGGLIGRT